MANATRKSHAAKQVASGAVGVSESGPVEFLVFRDNGGDYHWTIVTGSGESIAQSAGYASHKNAEYAARYVYEGQAPRDSMPEQLKSGPLRQCDVPAPPQLPAMPDTAAPERT